MKIAYKSGMYIKRLLHLAVFTSVTVLFLSGLFVSGLAGLDGNNGYTAENKGLNATSFVADVEEKSTSWGNGGAVLSSCRLVSPNHQDAGYKLQVPAVLFSAFPQELSYISFRS